MTDTTFWLGRDGEQAGKDDRPPPKEHDALDDALRATERERDVQYGAGVRSR